MTKTNQPMGTIDFEGDVQQIEDRAIVRLPQEASDRLSSRGQIAAEVSIGTVEFATVVEPDGMRGHWLSLSPHQLSELNASDGQSVSVKLTPTKAWPEPKVPADLQKALDDAPDITDVWDGITPMARWEWVRWVNATKNPQTRQRRVDVSVSKMRSGKRRPCCFDLSSCTDPELSKSGKLVD